LELALSSPWLISTAELEQRLADPGLRLFDTHVFLTPKPGGGYDIESGRDAWRESHIPGASFIDVQADISDPHHKLRYMMPPEEQFVVAMSRLGIGPQHQVVLYNRGATWWATRVFFMLRAFGFDAVRVLDGGFDKWQLENRALQSGETWYPPATFRAGTKRRFFVDQDTVLQAVRGGNAALVNALSPEVFSGKVVGYGRPGRIAGSCNVAAKDLLDPQTQAFLPADVLCARLGAAGLLGDRPVIAYCGGGISATTDAFALLMLGREDVTIYDASMNEWGPDASLPMESG
jgi:thiosulfate/3-mercaptopyruvate sulfurtransferase